LSTGGEEKVNSREPTEVRDALDELSLYLEDKVPPLLVADSVRLLFAQPSRILAQHLVSWAATQGASTRDEFGETVCAALTRIVQLADLRLIPRFEMNAGLAKLKPVLLTMCPVEAQLKVSALIDQFLEVQDRGSQEADKSGDREFSDILSRHLLSLLEQRTQNLTQDADAARAQEVVSQLLAAVTRTAETAQQLEERLARLKALGVDTEVPSMLRALGQSLPNWALIPPPSEEQKPGVLPGDRSAGSPAGPELAHSDARLRAMQRIVELTNAPEESADRFNHMLQTAVEQFNQGALGRAVSILGSAEELVRQERIQFGRVKPLWDKAAEQIQWQRFESAILDPVQHQLLGQFLSFFSAFSPTRLLAELRESPERHRRRLLISLLTVRGEKVRPEVWGHLGILARSQEPEWDYLRDLINLLASLPHQDGDVPEEELELMTRIAALPLPLPVLREAVRYGTRIRVDQAATLLTQLLGQASLGNPDELAAKCAPASHWALLFEQILTRLAFSSDVRMHRLVLDHCLVTGKSGQFSTAPLTVWAGTDLSAEPDVVARLVGALQKSLPPRWLDWILRPNETVLLDLTRALSGTSSPRVRALLQKVARRFPERSFGIAAAKAVSPITQPEVEEHAVQEGEAGSPPCLEKQESAAAVVDPDILLLEGELQSFKLPTLIQHLESTAATGILELLNVTEGVEGTATFVKGQLLHCQTGPLRGREALFALLERPVFGRFRLLGSKHQEEGAASLTGEPSSAFPVVPTLLEGMRRYDEYQQLRLLVPDQTVLMPSGELPGRPEGETDTKFVRQVWAEAVSGKTAAECEAAIRVDPYRVRRLLAYWVAEGSLLAHTGSAGVLQH